MGLSLLINSLINWYYLEPMQCWVHHLYCISYFGVMLKLSVAEEVGSVTLTIVRAQGLLGEVTVEWRTIDGTARSTGKTPPDFRVRKRIPMSIFGMPRDRWEKTLCSLILMGSDWVYYNNEEALVQYFCSMLNCKSTGQVIDLAHGAWFKPKFISSRISPAQYSLTSQNSLWPETSFIHYNIKCTPIYKHDSPLMDCFLFDIFWSSTSQPSLCGINSY